MKKCFHTTTLELIVYNYAVHYTAINGTLKWSKTELANAKNKNTTVLATSLCLMASSSSNILCRSNEGRNACSLTIMASSFGVLRPADSDKQTVSSMIVPGKSDKDTTTTRDYQK